MSYFHMSQTVMPEGTELKPRGADHVDPEVEAILEGYRPSHCIARKDGVYLSQTEDTARHGLTYDEGYLHTIEPSGEVQKRDSRWIGELQLRHGKKLPVKQKYVEVSDEELAKRYWEGAASEAPTWEFVTRGAKVVAVDNAPRKVRPAGGLLGLL